MKHLYLNCNHSPQSTSLVFQTDDSTHSDIVLLTEPYIHKSTGTFSLAGIHSPLTVNALPFLYIHTFTSHQFYTPSVTYRWSPYKPTIPQCLSTAFIFPPMKILLPPYSTRLFLIICNFNLTFTYWLLLTLFSG